MNRKRGTFSLPEEMQTTERLSTKKELAQKGSHPSCPSVPNKIRRSFPTYKNGSIKPKPVCFSNTVFLSSVYNPKMSTSYLDQVFAKYGLMGEGSFGRVYRVRSREDRKLYAIKRLKSNVSYKDRYAEVKNNEKIGIDPNCVQFFMAWEENCETFMLLECCDMSLADYSKKNNDIPEELLWNVLYDMCKALNFLHKRNFLHLDVKPGNIMMKSGHYKLGDFGLLSDLKSGEYVCKSTLSEGDSKYLALEVLEGIYTPSCDIFGLGISLLELAADLELPDHGPLWQQLRHDLLPQTFYDRVSLGFKVIVERMITPAYNRRPSAEKLLTFTSLKLIAKRDARKPRKNFAAEYMNKYEDCEMLPLASIPLNNNIIEAPTDGHGHNIRDEEDIKRHENEHNTGFNGRKSLFHILRNDSPFSNSKNSLSPFSDSSLIDVTMENSTLAETLSDSSMEIENNEMNSCSESQANLNIPLSGGHIIMSTPILKIRQTRRMPKAKLTFD